MPDKVEVILHNQAADIALVHEALDKLAAQHQLPARAISRLQLAIEEHLTNVMVHGYKPGQPGTLSVRIVLEPEFLRVEIEDDAMPFDPTRAPEVDVSEPFESRPIGGLGILMTRKSVDEIEYRRAGGRNLLVLKTRLAEAK